MTEGIADQRTSKQFTAYYLRQIKYKYGIQPGYLLLCKAGNCDFYKGPSFVKTIKIAGADLAAVKYMALFDLSIISQDLDKLNPKERQKLLKLISTSQELREGLIEKSKV